MSSKMEESLMQKLDYALSYLDKGISVIPLVSGGKKPLIPWEEYKTRLPTKGEVMAWFQDGRANIGAVCGTVSGGLVALDFESEESFTKFFSREKILSATLVVRTAHGGVHVWLRETGEVPRRSIRISKNPPLDLLGEGGYGVLPPSAIDHSKCDKSKCKSEGIGNYEIISSTTEIMPTKGIYEFVLRRCKELGWDLSAPKPKIDEILPGVPMGMRNVAAFEYARYLLFKIKLDPVTTLAELKRWNALNNPPLSEAELETVWKSAQRYPFEKGEVETKKSESANTDKTELKTQKAENKITMVPCLITDEFIAEECWDREKEEAYFLIRYFNSDKIERVDRINYNGTEYFPLTNPTLKKGLVLLPSGIEEATLAEVFREACDLTLTMYEAEEDKKEEIKFLVAIAISSWFYDRFNLQIPGMGAFAPIIALRGPSGSGKDRLLNALRLCSYRPFYNVSTQRIPSLYRPMDQWRGTLCLSEMDFINTSETSELTHYLNCRSYGVPISRQNPDNPKYNEVFYNFGLTIVTQRRVWDDNALEDRSLPYYCEKTQKEIPSEVLDEWVERGMELQKKLLYLRLMLWDKVVIDKGARVKGIKDHRLTASILPLLALLKLEPSLGTLIEENMKKLERKRREVKAMSKDGIVINKLYELWKEDLVGIHNGVKYIAKERESVESITDEEQFILVPLQISDLAEEFKWSTKEVRKILNSLQLHPDIEKLPKVIKLDRAYRPIWIDEKRLMSRFEEFVPDLVTQVTEVTHLLCVEGSKDISKSMDKVENSKCVTSVTKPEQSVTHNRSVTSVTSVTDSPLKTSWGELV